VTAERDAAIQEFADAIEIERRLTAAISKVVARSPSAVLIAWEEGKALHVTSIPYSKALIKGLTDMLYDVVNGESDPSDDDEA
jgi:hypothetical protein